MRVVSLSLVVFLSVAVPSVVLGDDAKPSQHIMNARGDILTEENAREIGAFFDEKPVEFQMLVTASETFRKRYEDFCEGCFWHEAHMKMKGTDTQAPLSASATVYEIGSFQGEEKARTEHPTPQEAWLDGAYRPALKKALGGYPGYAAKIDGLTYTEAYELYEKSGKRMDAAVLKKELDAIVGGRAQADLVYEREVLKKRLADDPTVLPDQLALIDRMDKKALSQLRIALAGDEPAGNVLAPMLKNWIAQTKDWLKHEVEISPFYKHYYTEKRDRKKVERLLDLIAGMSPDTLNYTVRIIEEAKPSCVGCYLGAWGGQQKIEQYLEDRRAIAGGATHSSQTQRRAQNQ